MLCSGQAEFEVWSFMWKVGVTPLNPNVVKKVQFREMEKNINELSHRSQEVL